MLRLEVAGRGTGEGQERRFMNVVIGGMKLGGVREEDRSQREKPEGNNEKGKKKEKKA